MDLSVYQDSNEVNPNSPVPPASPVSVFNSPRRISYSPNVPDPALVSPIHSRQSSPVAEPISDHVDEVDIRRSVSFLSFHSN